MRKAFALIEFLAAFVAIALTAVAVAALTRPLIIEIPRANRVMETNTSVQNMLARLRSDVEAAVCLPDAFADKRTDDKNLLIELPNGIVCYTCENNEVVRRVLKSQSQTDAEPEVWPLPMAKIHWQRWQKNGMSYALEVGTHIEYKQGRRMETKMANNHVYFVGSAAEVVCEK